MFQASFRHMGGEPLVYVTYAGGTCRDSGPWVPSRDFAESKPEEVELRPLSLAGPSREPRQAEEDRGVPTGEPLEEAPPFPTHCASRNGRPAFPSTSLSLAYECSSSSHLLRPQLCLKWAN